MVQDAVQDVFEAIAEPARRRILELLSDREHTVSELNAHFSFSQPALSKHLRVLRSSQLVSIHPQGRKNYYRLEADRLRDVYDWLAFYKKFWTRRLKRLEKYLDRQQETEPNE